MRAEPWIAALKVGDPVIVSQRGSILRLASVVTISPSGRIFADGKDFNPDGTQRGDKTASLYGRTTIVPATPERIGRIEHGERVNRLKYSVKWETLSPAKVREICAILDRPEPREEEGRG
jgi:hypothetical protein